MRRIFVLGLVLMGVACGGGGDGARDGRDVASDVGVDDPNAPESLFGDAPGSDHGTPVDTLLPDGAVPDLPAPDGTTPDTPTPDGVLPDAEAETAAPVEWDVLVLTGVKGHVYRNGSYYATVQNTSGSPFVAIDGVFSRYFTLTEDGQGRIDGEPTFEVDGVPSGVTFVDTAASTTATGTYFFTLQSNGQVRNQGGVMMTVAPPAGQAWAAMAAENDTFYLATNTGTLYQKNQLYPSLAVPASAADPVVTLRVLNGQFYALTQGGRVYKNAVLLSDLSAKAAPPFVGLDVTPAHVYVLSRACKVFEDQTELYTVTPFTGDSCAALATIHSLD